MPKKRIFIAIQVPEELKSAAEFYIKSFLDDRNIRIPKKEGWHVTVAFCGYLDDKEVEALKEVIKNAALEFRPFEFTPQKILFTPPYRPRMIWLDFAPSRDFADLKNKIENDILALRLRGLLRNFQRESREPHPHLTLARFKESYFPNIKKFLPPEGIDLTKKTAPFLIKSIDIMKSHLSRAGAEYELISKIDLR
jgi:2'-5' RNA ligase